MAYSDGLQFFIHGTATEGEAGAADIIDVDFPVPVSIELVGARTTEAWDVAGANAAIMSVDVSENAAEGDRTEKLTLTFPKAATTDGGAAGEFMYSTANVFPIKVPAGGRVTFEHKQAASDAGGAYVPFMIYRVDGLQKDASAVSGEAAA